MATSPSLSGDSIPSPNSPSQTQSISSPVSAESSQFSASPKSPVSTVRLINIQSFHLPKFQDSYITDVDRERAKELLTQQRVIDGKTKKIKKDEPFTSKEVNPVLAAVISDKSNPASPGLVQELLQQGGDVSIARQKSKALWKRVIRRDQEVRRSDVLATATQNCSLEVVWILSQHADDIAKTAALPFAIRQNDTAKARILLDSGADATEFHPEFLSSVENNADDMVEILLCASKGPCSACRTAGLVKAANNGSSRNTLILAEKGADADFENGAALQSAITAGREDLTNTIASCAKKPSAKSFDIAVGVSYSKLAQDAEKQHRMIETCLRGGATGSVTDETLVQACKSRQIALIDILLKFGASLDHRAGAALQYAITSKQPALLNTLLGGKKPSLSTLGTVIASATTLDDPAIAYETIDILLSAGLRGDAVAKTLIEVIKHPIRTIADSDNLKLIQLLLDKGEASVNFDGGKSIGLAGAGGVTEVLKLLLQHGPSIESLNAAFPLAIKLEDAAGRLEVATMILEAGASGTVVDEALLASAMTGKGGVELTSVILKRSSVDYQNGKALCNAINSCSVEQMQALMVGRPSENTLRAAWADADALQDDKFQYQAFQTLLTVQVESSLKDNSLISAVMRGQRGIQVCTLLLQHQASPDYSSGACVVGAAKGLHLDALHLLADSINSDSTFSTAFNAFSDGDDWLTPRGLEVIHFLLESGATGPEVDIAFCRAARLYDPDAVELLVSSINPEVVGVALATVTHSTKDWLSPDNRHLWLIHSLLEWGAAGECVNIVLLEALEAFASGLTSEDLIDTLLYVGAKADVNFQDGKALQIAVRHGNVALLEKLASCGATTETMSMAFAEAITAGHGETRLISLIDILMKNKGARPDVKTPPIDYQPPIFACLAAYPNSEKLVKRLVKIGCNLESQIDSFVYDDTEPQAEKVTPLTWALCQTVNAISSAVIEALIKAKTDTNFTTATSLATPLILASKNSRSDLVGILLEQKAKVGARDHFDRTALFYSSRNGDVESVNALIKAKSPLNDGSVHEAAKNLHSTVVAALIKGKHHPDFPSSKEQHEGRTALQEMALMCDCKNVSAQIEETIRALVAGKANPLEKSRGKNALFLALDNANPVPITRAILDSIMWKHMANEENVYIEVDPETGVKYYFSPTMYVSRGFSQGPEKENAQLLKLLFDKRGVDRYYAELGEEQPLDAVGMPQTIADAEKKRKTREEKLRQQELDHQLKLLHEKQAAEHKAEIERAKHEEEMFRKNELAQQKLEQKEMEHQQKLVQEAEKTNQKQKIMASTTVLKINLQEQVDAQKQRAVQARAQFDEMQKARLAQQKALALQQEQELKLRFTEQANAQKIALKARQNRLAAAASQQKLLAAERMAQTHAAEARHKLAIKERQNEQAMKLMRGTTQQKHHLHEMQMQELHAKGENVKLKMLDKYFDGNKQSLLRIGK